MPKKYLWKEIEPSDEFALRLKAAAQKEDPDLKTLALEGADRLAKLHDEMVMVITSIMKRKSPVETVVFLLQAGIDRNDLRYNWSVPKELILQAEADRRHKA